MSEHDQIEWLNNETDIPLGGQISSLRRLNRLVRAGGVDSTR